MYLLFEGIKYSRAQLVGINLSPHLYNNADYFIIDKCGYCCPSPDGAPVFFLPKVFVNGKNLFLGQYEIDGVVDTCDNRYADNPEIRDIVFSLSTWLYAAMLTYKKRVAQRSSSTTVLNQAESQSIISNIGEDEYTSLDIIIAMWDFYKHNKALFIKVVKESHSRLSKINWQKTVTQSFPYFQDDNPIYMHLSGTRKDINYDEELITLFFSTLSYISDTFGMFDFNCPAGYSIKPTHIIEDGLASGIIESHLMRIKRNYFSDRMRYLWQLLYMFYAHTDGADTAKEKSKYLLVNSFQNVFEDMIEYLIGEETLADNKLKKQKDGHQIDHIFKYQSLIYNEETIFYVGDSKYYKDTSDIQEYSEEKQYTYAHNVIKYNMDFFMNPRLGNRKEFIAGTRYRDEITEGYSITPNFFISGVIKDADDYESNDFEMRTDKYGNPEPPKSTAYFDDRLFDRDTLFLQHYDINFLYVMSSYVTGNNTERNSFREELYRKLRSNFISFFNSKYNFYIIQNPYGGLKSFVDKHFRILTGKIFRTSDDRLILALEKKPRDINEQQLIFKNLQGTCELKQFNLQ